MVIVNIDIARLMHSNTPSCGAFYADGGSYLTSPKRGQPRKSMKNNTELFSWGAAPIREFPLRSLHQSYTDRGLKKFGKKSPDELTVIDMNDMKNSEPNAYKVLQLWFWALKFSNTVTLQLGWGQMSYNNDGLQVEYI